MNDVSKTNEDYYKRVLATASKLEAIQGNLESVIDFFLTPIVKLYTKLCNDCLRLIFDCEFKLDHFRKAEELVWRRVYHDLYRLQKSKRQQLKKQDEHLIEYHFISGIGFYSSFIVRLRSRFKIYDAVGINHPLNLTLGPVDNFHQNQRLNQEDNFKDDDDSMCLSSLDDPSLTKAQEWARQAVYRSMVYMGDLARYLLETSQIDYRNIAFEFYRSASRNQPEHGLPFNQLATLAGSQNYNLDAVCNYMRCCLRPKPFEGGEGNMKKIFDLNKIFYEEILSTGYTSEISEVLSSKEPSLAAESMIRATIIIFIQLTSDLWSAISESVDTIKQDTLSTETRQFFELLREALELEPIVPLANTSNFIEPFSPISSRSNNSSKPKYVSPTVMYEFCNISIMLIAKCQKVEALNTNSPEPVDSHVVNLVNTLALNLLHYSSAKCQKTIIGKLQDLRLHCKASAQKNNLSVDKLGILQRNSSDTYMDDSNSNSACHRSNEHLNSLNDNSTRRVLYRMRQKRAATNYLGSKSKLNFSINNEDSDMSELEETALSTIDALDISSDMSEDATGNDLINLDSTSDDGSSKNETILQKPRMLRPTRSQNYELKRSDNLLGSSNSLPIPDLVTGETNDRGFVQFTNQSPATADSPNGSVQNEKHNDGNFLDIDTPESISEVDTAMEFVYKQTFLPTIKIFCDWLLANSSIIRSSRQSFLNFSYELKDMVSLLEDLRRIVSPNVSGELKTQSVVDSLGSAKSEVLRHFYDGPQWIQRFPLSCDYPLQCLDPMKSVHNINIDFNYSKDLSDSEAGFVTIQCIKAFSYALGIFLENKKFH